MAANYGRNTSGISWYSRGGTGKNPGLLRKRYPAKSANSYPSAVPRALPFEYPIRADKGVLKNSEFEAPLPGKVHLTALPPLPEPLPEHPPLLIQTPTH